MSATEEIRRWLALDALSRVSQVRKLALLEAFPWAELWERAAAGRLPGLSTAQHRALLEPDGHAIDHTLTWLQAAPHHHFIPLTDPRYPLALRHTEDPPLILFAAGEAEWLQQPMLAMVGSRNASLSGRQLAERWAASLAGLGWVLVSGLAEGIDGAAHRGALSQGPTVSVEGSGLASVYPKAHIGLAKEIEQCGVRVSEFWPSEGVRRSHFPKRNRIVSGLSRGVVVVEAGLKSGSLITARLANEQGRDVFAVPGSVLDPKRVGCHYLIQQGAKLAADPVDIIEELLPQLSREALEALIRVPQANVESLPVPALLDSVGYEATSVDDVVAISQLPVDVVLEQLTEMELDGWVAAVPGGYVRLRGKR
ncbi:DNA-processing protein DprA [Marinobacter hydrocarbonoclasticus]|nr:DNA-processing protein DprA [Marinobacter nauticus]